MLAREADPAWYLDRAMGSHNAVCGQVFRKPRRDVRSRISPILKDLGVNYVHLMPVLKSPEGENDGGYAVSDYRDVDPRFGTLGGSARDCGGSQERRHAPLPRCRAQQYLR